MLPISKKLQYQLNKFDLTDEQIKQFIFDELDKRVEKILNIRERMCQDAMKFNNLTSFDRNSHALKNDVISLQRAMTELLDLVLLDEEQPN